MASSKQTRKATFSFGDKTIKIDSTRITYSDRTGASLSLDLGEIDSGVINKTKVSAHAAPLLSLSLIITLARQEAGAHTSELERLTQGVADLLRSKGVTPDRFASVIMSTAVSILKCESLDEGALKHQRETSGKNLSLPELLFAMFLGAVTNPNSDLAALPAGV